MLTEIDKARTALMVAVQGHVGNATFTDYIEAELAGDFAIVLAEILAAHPVADAAVAPQDAAEFAKLQTFLTAHHAGTRPAHPAGLAAWALAALTNARRAAFNEAASVDARTIAMLMATGKVSKEDVDAALEQVGKSVNLAAPTPTVAADAVAPQDDRDTAQLTDWLMTDPQTGEKLRFAGPLELDFLRFSRVKLQGKSGAVWTLSARLEEGYLTAEERLENIKRAAQEAAND